SSQPTSPSKNRRGYRPNQSNHGKSNEEQGIPRMGQPIQRELSTHKPNRSRRIPRHAPPSRHHPRKQPRYSRIQLRNQNSYTPPRGILSKSSNQLKESKPMNTKAKQYLPDTTPRGVSPHPTDKSLHGCIAISPQFISTD